ncbi:MAG: hypothetical protein IT383_01005 [Deltaproteobacteria bacterium]|nr:hypothetical protein [Deltaproteobacteria bacterium]
MRHTFRLVLVLACTVALACGGASALEDDAYDLAKTSAQRDLACNDVSVKKMAQGEGEFSYATEGCSSTYYYLIACEGGVLGADCAVKAGARTPELLAQAHGVMGRAVGFVDRLLDSAERDLENFDKDSAEIRERHRKMREKIDASSATIECHARGGIIAADGSCAAHPLSNRPLLTPP